jgi:DNA-binding MarR family transcriptional regulator
MPWTWSLGEPLEFLRLLWAVAHALHSTSKRLEVTMGITGPQRLALQMVGRFPQITAGQLAQLLHVDPSTLTGIVQRLVRRGLVQRRPDARDGRRTLLGLTTEGRRFEASTSKPGKVGKTGRGATETAEAAVARALTGLRPAEIAAARRTLTALSAALGDGPTAKTATRATTASTRTRSGGKAAPGSKPARTTAKKTTRPRRIAVAPRSGSQPTMFAPRATRARVVLGS